MRFLYSSSEILEYANRFREEELLLFLQSISKFYALTTKSCVDFGTCNNSDETRQLLSKTSIRYPIYAVSVCHFIWLLETRAV